MEVQVTWWGVMLASISSIAIGMLWYLPNVLGNQTFKLMNINKQQVKKINPSMAMVQILVGSIVTAFVLNHFIVLSHYFYDISWYKAGLGTAIWAWIGFSFTSLSIHSAFDTRPISLTLLNVANRLLTFIANGLIIAYFLGR